MSSPLSMPVRIRRKMPTPIILAQYLLLPDIAVDRIAAIRLGHQHCQALAAVGGGQRPGLIVSVAQSESPSAGSGCRNSSAEIYGSSPPLTTVAFDPTVRAFSLDSTGNNLPTEHAPWHRDSRGAAITIDPETDPIAGDIREKGYFVVRTGDQA
jgi:hypothetical protein